MVVKNKCFGNYHIKIDEDGLTLVNETNKDNNLYPLNIFTSVKIIFGKQLVESSSVQVLSVVDFIKKFSEFRQQIENEH